MKMLKFNEMAKSQVARKIAHIKDVFVELEDEGYGVKIVNGYSHQNRVGKYIFDTPGMSKPNSVFHSSKLIYVYITPTHTGDFTDEEYDEIIKYEKYAKDMITKWRGASGGYQYYLMYFNK